jgi:hypothetical protein
LNYLRKPHILRRSTTKKMARKGSKTKTVYRVAKKVYRAGKRRGMFKGGKGGSLMNKTWNGFKEGTAYSIVASRFAPQLAPLAQLYGEWKGGGIEGLLILELFVNQLLGRPSGLGALGLNLNLGGLLGQGGGGTMMMPKQSV